MKLNPRRCRVTDCGILICEDIGKHKQKSRYLFIFDKFGNPLLRNVHRDYIGDIFDLVDDQSVFKYELNMTHRKLEINLKELIK